MTPPSIAENHGHYGYHYALIKDNKVINYVVMPEEDDEFLSSLVEVNDADEAVLCSSDLVPTLDYGIGSLYLDGEFTPPPAGDQKSFVWDAQTASWVPPTPKPEGHFFWSNESDSWEPYPQPYESWTWDGSTWNPPVPRPVDSDGNVTPHQWIESTLSWVEIPAPYPSYVWSPTHEDWMAPVPLTVELVRANVGKNIVWNEEIVNWEFIDVE
jgi:hypothetical protein